MKRANPRLIGAFTVGGLALGVLAIVLFGSARLFERSTRFVLFFDQSVSGLRVGAPVSFRGVTVGRVERIPLSWPGQSLEDARIPVIVDVDHARIDAAQLGLDLNDRAAVDRLIRRLGLRAQLESQSLVTGLKYIQLDLRPETPIELEPSVRDTYQQIPTVPTDLMAATESLSQVAASLGRIDYEELAQTVQRAIAGIDALVRSPQVASTLQSVEATMISVRELTLDVSQQIDPLGTELRATSADARDALVSLKRTMDSVQLIIDPESPLIHAAEAALAEVRRAALSVELLADGVERDPSSLVFGKAMTAEDARSR